MTEMPAPPFLLVDGDTTTQPVPRGWALTPIGAWAGRAAVVGYDPRRYDVLVMGEGIDDRTVAGLLECGFRRHATAPAAWQARLDRRVICEGTWHDCAVQAYEAIAYAHNHESQYGMTTSEGAEALLKLGAQAHEDEPVAVRAYDLSVSVRPKGPARALWIRDRLAATTAALDRTARSKPCRRRSQLVTGYRDRRGRRHPPPKPPSGSLGGAVSDSPNMTPEQASSQAMALRARYFRLMDVQNTPCVVIVNGERQHSDQLLDDLELDADVDRACDELDAFIAEHRDILQGTTFARIWGAPEFAPTDPAASAPGDISEHAPPHPDTDRHASVRQRLEYLDQTRDLPSPDLGPL